MKTGKTKIILICPSRIIRIGLKHIIDNEVSLCIIESLNSLSEDNLKKIEEHRPDIVLIDPSAASTDALDSLKEHYPALDGHLLVGLFNNAYPQKIIEQFDGYFTINDTPSTIIKSLMDKVNSSAEQTPIESTGDGCVLSLREKEILSEVAKGLTNKEIADKLSISIFTVTTHRKNISQKLGIHSIAGLTVYAVMNHIVSKEQIM